MLKAEDPLLTLLVTCRISPSARIDSAQRNIAALKVPLEVEIIDGLIAEDTEVDTLYDERRNRFEMKRPLVRKEIAVYGSHRRAWERLLQSGKPAALILEDDFAIRDQATFLSVINNSANILGTNRDIVKLFDFEKKVAQLPFFQRKVDEVTLVKWSRPTAGMVAYLITREAAQKFLSRTQIWRQVDEDTKFFWELDLDIWSVPGCPVIDNSYVLGGSLIESERQRNRQRHLFRSLWGNILTVNRRLRTHYYLRVERKKWSKLNE
jgi:glycosyl transferase family 25